MQIEREKKRTEVRRGGRGRAREGEFGIGVEQRKFLRLFLASRSAVSSQTRFPICENSLTNFLCVSFRVECVWTLIRSDWVTNTRLYHHSRFLLPRLWVGKVIIFESLIYFKITVQLNIFYRLTFLLCYLYILHFSPSNL